MYSQNKLNVRKRPNYTVTIAILARKWERMTQKNDSDNSFDNTNNKAQKCNRKCLLIIIITVSVNSLTASKYLEWKF